jgi:hypothetical protein
MAHAPQSADTPDVTERRRGWHFFLMASKWFALHVLGLVFFLIFILVGHAPIIPTFVLVVLAVYIVGSVLH